MTEESHRNRGFDPRQMLAFFPIIPFSTPLLPFYPCLFSSIIFDNVRYRIGGIVSLLMNELAPVTMQHVWVLVQMVSKHSVCHFLFFFSCSPLFLLSPSLN